MWSGHRQHGLATYHVRRHVGSGFTGIEFLVAVCVLAILAAISVPTLMAKNREHIDDPTYRAAAVEFVERVELRFAMVVAVHPMKRETTFHRTAFGCLGDDDVVLQVEGVDQKERRVRMTVCCHSAVPDTATCAFSSSSRSHIEEL